MFHSIFLLSTLIASTLAALSDGGPGTICPPDGDSGPPELCPLVITGDGLCCDPAKVQVDPAFTTTLKPEETTLFNPSATTQGNVIFTNSPGAGNTGNCTDLPNPQTGVSDCPQRANLCNDQIYYDVMTIQCPMTCGRCQTGNRTGNTGSCADLPNPQTGVSDCPQRANLCNDQIYYDVMTIQCPMTCGRCQTRGTGDARTCVDKVNPQTLVSDCPSRKNLCTDSTYATLMAQECPQTCGKCNSGTIGRGTTISSGSGIGGTKSTGCIDKINLSTGVSDCPQRSELCNNPVYMDLMTQQCPQTCGRCSGVGSGIISTTSNSIQTNRATVSGESCTDLINPRTGTSDCPARSSLCNHSIYLPLMKVQCPKTCGFC